MKTNKKILLIISLAIIFRLTLFLISVQCNGYDNFINKIFIVPGNDTYTYNQLALNLINYKTFTYQFGLPPVSLRTPGYPIFIAIIYTIFGINPLYVLIVQIIIDSLTVLIIFKISRIFFSNSLSLLAAFLYAIGPHASIFSLSMYSDTLFVFFITLSAYLFLYSITKNKNQEFILSSIFLGISNLIKPAAMFIPAIFIFILFLVNKKDLKNITVKSLTFILFFVITLSPWLYRNYHNFNKIFLSTSGEYNLLVLNIAPLKSSIFKVPQEEAINKLLAEADSLMKIDGVKPQFLKKPINYWEELTLQYDFNKAEYWKTLAWHYIKTYPLEFCMHYFLGIFHSFANLGTGTYATYFNLVEGKKSFNIKEEKNIFILLKKFIENKSFAEISIGFIISLYLLPVYLGFIVGLFKLKDFIYAKYFLILMVIYFVLIAGGGGLARFKLPSIPFYLIFTSFGLFEIWTKYIKKRFLRLS